MRWHISALLGILSLFCFSCTLHRQTDSTDTVRQNIETAQSKQGFIERRIYTNTFSLYALLRPAHAIAHTIHVYIEGDGLAWLTRHRPSKDPTPTKSTTLDLAKHDPSNNAVLYLARPCQYMSSDVMGLCSKKYWTSHRLAPEVIQALNEAIDQIKAEVQAKHVVLIGYSGGGAAAALVASHRSDVIFLGSAAGNLDIHGWTSWHKVSKLTGSQDPMRITHAIQHIPQRHVSSYDDSIVPPQISENFCNAQQKMEYCQQISGMSHGGDWYTMWNYSYK